ncbi:MAG TPA: protein-ADP-ribose hydrolase, partial [Ruminococcaceae bacterium]|nr:protein-ADP-ribose hydrolase [Oscillospiraceae bacterium]
YNLPCKYVIHTVGPIVSGGLNERHCGLLKSCYLSCLKLAEENGCKSIAFCCISTGVFGFPQREAAEIAVSTVKEYLKTTGSDIKVIFNVFKDEDLMIYRSVLNHQAL